MANKIEKKDLMNVNGGAGLIEEPISTRCKKCYSIVHYDEVQTRIMRDGCQEFTVYKCPNCQSWVNRNGDVK